MDYKEQRRLDKELRFKICYIRALEAKLAQIEKVMTVPAGNPRRMQIAGPARQVLNIIRSDILAKVISEAERTYPKPLELFPDKCPPSPTPSSPPIASATSAAGPATSQPSAPPAGFGQVSIEQLRVLDRFLLEVPSEFPQLNERILTTLWKIVRPGAMMAAGISTSEPTPKPNDSGKND